jgi:hypothetical protein
MACGGAALGSSTQTQCFPQLLVTPLPGVPSTVGACALGGPIGRRRNSCGSCILKSDTLGTSQTARRPHGEDRTNDQDSSGFGSAGPRSYEDAASNRVVFDARSPEIRKFEIVPAARGPTPMLIGLSGPAGSGKTYSALRLASGIQRVAGGDVVVIDTENRRSRHYADKFAFQLLDMAPPFGSTDYLAALAAAVSAKPGVIIIDTLSHEHDGEGGMLEFCATELDRLGGEDPIHQQRAQKAAWRRPRASRRALLSALTRLNVHCIVCFRATERTRQPKEGSTEMLELGFTPVGGVEFLHEMTCSTLLRPGAQGVPAWASTLPGEHAAIKLPAQFVDVFAEGTPLSESDGEAMARWAAGPPISRASRSQQRRQLSLAPKQPNARRQRKAKTAALRTAAQADLAEAAP